MAYFQGRLLLVSGGLGKSLLVVLGWLVDCWSVGWLLVWCFLCKTTDLHTRVVTRTLLKDQNLPFCRDILEP